MVDAVRHPPGALPTGFVDDVAIPPGTLQVAVVSPARPVYEGEARFVTVAAAQGQMGVWPRHADIVAALGAGRLRIGHADGSEERFAVWGGFVKVGGPKVTILVDRAVSADEIDTGAVQKELEETVRALQHPKSDAEFAELLERRRWCQARLKLAS